MKGNENIIVCGFPEKGLNLGVYEFTENSVVDIKRYGKVLSYSIENIGTTAVTIWNQKVINPGDPMAYVPPTTGYYRIDQFSISFNGGAGKILLYVDIEQSS